MQYFGFTIADFIPCEIPGCGARANDINHIDARGMGGNPSGDKDDINNLMAMCRNHHVKHGDIKSDKAWLKEVHWNYMAAHGKSR